MRLPFLAPLLLLGALCGCGTPLSAPADLRASRALVENVRGDAVFLITGNGCSDDMIGTGSFQLQRSVTEPSSGGFIGWIDTDIRGEAYNVAGVRYRFSSAERLSLRVTAGDALTRSSRLRLIGQGSTPNIDAQLNYKIAFNANGDLTVYRDSFRITCE